MWSGEKILEMGTSWRVEVVGRNLNRAGTGWELPVNGERSPFTQLPLFERRTYQNRKERRHICGLYPCQYIPNLMWAIVDDWPDLSCSSELLAARWLAKT